MEDELQAIINDMYGKVCADVSGKLFEREKLLEENKKLKKENEALKKELASVKAELIKLHILNQNGYISYGIRNG